MQRIFLSVLFIAGIAYNSQAQMDVQLNPVGILFNSVDLSAEFGVSPDFGIEGNLGYDFQNYDFDDVQYKNNAFGVRAIGKYYFSPQDGTDRWNVGGYLRYSQGKATVNDQDNSSGDVKNTKLALGFYTGYKWVSRKNVVFELGIGLGRKLIRTYEYSDGTTVNTDDIPLLNADVFGRLSLGYRFGGPKSKHKG